MTLAHRFLGRDAADGVLDLWNAVTGERVTRLVDCVDLGRTAMFTVDGDLLFCGWKGDKLHPIGSRAAVALEGEFCLLDPMTGHLKQSFQNAPRLPDMARLYGGHGNRTGRACDVLHGKRWRHSYL